MPTLALNNFNIVLSVLGGWVSVFGLVSYLLKENFYLSEALISLLAGVAFSPPAANLIRPLEYTGSQENLNTVTLYFSRLVLGVQLVLAGIQLPSRYLKKQWKPLALLLGPIMTLMWLAASLLVWACVPNLPFLHALVVGSCIAPTDPVLSNVIVKGKFADRNVPVELQNIIVAESGANDGLGYPFLFLALYLIKYVGSGYDSDVALPEGGAASAMGMWFGETWGYTILLSVVYGGVVGWVAKELLHWAEERKFVDRESFLVFAVSLALFITGTCGLIGSDDVLACFIAGNVFTWDDWFRLETEDDSLQPTVDMMLNVSIFMWYGAVCPWHEFLVNDVISLWRLVLLGIAILLLRRLPWVFAMHKFIPQIEQARQALFVGFFGPVGVSGVFYLYITLEFLRTLDVHHDEPRADLEHLPEVVHVVVWFIAICSIVVHGLSIPLGKLGYYLPQTLSRGVSLSGAVTPPFNIGSRVNSFTISRPPLPSRSRRNSIDQASRGVVLPAATDAEVVKTPELEPNGSVSSASASASAPAVEGNGKGSVRKIFKIGGSIIPSNSKVGADGACDQLDGSPSAVVTPPAVVARTIRFPDEIRPVGDGGQDGGKQ